MNWHHSNLEKRSLNICLWINQTVNWSAWIFQILPMKRRVSRRHPEVGRSLLMLAHSEFRWGRWWLIFLLTKRAGMTDGKNSAPGRKKVSNIKANWSDWWMQIQRLLTGSWTHLAYQNQRTKKRRSAKKLYSRPQRKPLRL